MAKKKIPNKQKTPPRKPKQQWHLSRRAKWGLIAAAAAIALIAIIWTIVYNMQAIPLDAEGNIVTHEGQNWLVYNEKNQSNPRYIKLGEVEPAEGYVLDKKDSISDANEPLYYFKPVSSEAPAITYAAMVGKGDYQTISENTLAAAPAMLTGTAASELTKTQMSGRNVSYYFYNGGMMNAEDAEKIDYYTKKINAYVEAPRGKCVVLMLDQRSDTGTDYLDDQAFIAVLEKAVAELKV